MYQISIANTIQSHVYNEDTQEVEARDAEIVQYEEQVLKDAKAAEIQAKIDEYRAQQQYQLQHGGSGPSAEFEIMKIVNEYNSQFEVMFKN